MQETGALSERARTGLSGRGARALLIGAGTYTAESGLPDVPAVRANLADLKQVLVERCGMDKGNVRMVCDPASQTEVGVALAEEAERAEDVLLVYYAGHGLVSLGGELYLATSGTDRRGSRLAYTALGYAAVRNSLLDCRARSTVVILDCCFSGRAAGVLSGSEASTTAVDLAQVSGVYLLASAGREELALAPEGARHTAFTGELIRLLREGDSESPSELRLNDVYRYLDRTLPAKGYPRPQRRASEWIDEFVLAPNPAFRLPEPAPPADETDETDVCPYPGLAAFSTEEARWFFGRRQETIDLVGRIARRLEQAAPLAVVGPSGSGKSSLLRAGLLHTLATSTLLGPGAPTWPRLLLTPGADPVGTLAARLAELASEDPSAVRTELMEEPRRGMDVARRALRAQAGGDRISGARLVVVVDQFEEVFTQCEDERERRVFIRALCAAAGSPDEGDGEAEYASQVPRSEPPALVVIAVRADLYGWCAAHPELRRALQDGQVVLGPMRTSELRSAIEGPAEAAGLSLQEGLVQELLHDLGVEQNGQGRANGDGVYDPGALPLLSHALRVTWEHRSDQQLTLEGYQATGGIRGAVAITAERAFQQFDEPQQQVARQLLLRLVQIGDGTAAARRRVDRETLLSQAPEPDRAATVLEELARARLVTADAESVEITHEALLGAWPRLRRWIETDRAGLHIHQQLTEAANAWAQAGKPPARLYRGTDLTLASDWAEDLDHRNDLSPVETEFLAASRQLRIDQDRRRERLPRLFMMSAAVLLAVVAVPIGIWLVWSGFLLKSSCVDSGEVVESSGECIGVNGEGYDFRNKEIAAVSRDIAKENNRVEAAHEPHVTVAMMLPLDSENAARRQHIRSELLGAYLGQKKLNEDPGKSNIRLVLANPGKSYDQQGKVVDTLLEMSRTQDKLRAVTVSDSNVGSGEAENAVERLTEHHVPVLASPFGGDTIANTESSRGEPRFPGLARITPTDREMAQALTDWRGRSQDRKTVAVYDQRLKDDPYAGSLRDAFSRIKEEGPHGPEAIPFLSPAAGEAETTPHQFRNATSQICESEVDTVYFAGRAPQLGSLVRALAERVCEERRLTIVTGPDAASSKLTDRSWQYAMRAGGVTVQYVAPGHPDAWRTELRKWQAKSENPPQYLAEPAEAVQQLRDRLRKVGAAGIGAPPALDDSRTMLAYDGLITTGQALQLVQRDEAKAPSLAAVRKGWVLLYGQSRVRGTSGLICLSSDGNPRNKPVAVVELGPAKKGPRFGGLRWPDGKPQAKDCATPRR